MMVGSKESVMCNSVNPRAEDFVPVPTHKKVIEAEDTYQKTFTHFNAHAKHQSLR